MKKGINIWAFLIPTALALILVFVFYKVALWNRWVYDAVLIVSAVVYGVVKIKNKRKIMRLKGQNPPSISHYTLLLLKITAVLLVSFALAVLITALNMLNPVIAIASLPVIAFGYIKFIKAVKKAKKRTLQNADGSRAEL